VEAGDQYPEETQESQDKERVVEPQPAARIYNHPNACSGEHLFQCKAGRQHKCITSLTRWPLVAAPLMLVWLTAACLPDARRLQLGDLFDQLVSAQRLLGEQPFQPADACITVGDVQTRLAGEPGLVDVRPTWPALRDAAVALNAVCGQATLLNQPATDSEALAQARERWQQGIQREIGVACDYLRAAAAALDRTQPC
jgi:hypothetical protein